MGEVNESGPRRKITRAHFQALCDAQFRSYLMDPQLNTLLKYMKEIKDVQKQIDEVCKEIESYEQTYEVIVKHQENFLHKFGFLPKQGTRTVGVNVNITAPEERVHAVTDAKQNLTKQLPVETTVKQIKADPSPVPASPIQVGSIKVNAAKRTAVDVVDLTLDEDKTRPKQFKSENVQNYKSTPQDRIQSSPRDNVNYTAVPLMTSMPQVIQIGSPPVQYSTAGAYPNALFGQPQTAPPGMLPPQRITYVLPSNSPLLPSNSPLGVVPRVAISNSRPGELPVRFPSPGTVYVTSRPPGPMIASRATLEALANTLRGAPRHPAPLPEAPKYVTKSILLLEPPPKPSLKLTKPTNGIVLSWNMTLAASHDKIKSYQLYGYEETTSTPDTSLWKKVGEVNALPLPMACTLTQFADGRRYHFAIRAIDVHSRMGPFSDVASISLL